MRDMSAAGPNILWIVTTQWRAQACGYAGDPNARTPCLDALAAESMNFTQAVTPHPFGPFARAAMLTGVPSPENGVRNYFDPLPAGARTLAHTLGERGYATAFFGKWHLWKRDRTVPLVGEAHAKIVVPPEARGGFEFWEGFESGFLLNDPWLHGTRLAQPERFEGYQSDVIGARAEKWIGEKIPHPQSQTPKKVQPWFCMVSLEPPHPPYAAQASGVVACEPNAIELPANVPRGGEIEKQVRRELAGYYAHIEATDRAIGQLLARAPRENTLVVFTSVHGDMHGAHGVFRKGWPYEESVRVPLLVRGPPRTEAESQKPEVRDQKASSYDPSTGSTHATGSTGSPQASSGPWRTGRRDDAVSLVDLPAMMLAEVEDLKSEPGRRKAESGKHFARISMPSVVHLPHQCDREWRGVRTKIRKLVLNAHSTGSTGSPQAGSGQADGTPWLFFDLENDPHELRNLASDAAWARERAELQSLVGYSVLTTNHTNRH